MRFQPTLISLSRLLVAFVTVLIAPGVAGAIPSVASQSLRQARPQAATAYTYVPMNAPPGGDPINLASGADIYVIPPDMKVANASGPAAIFERTCYSNSAMVGYGSPGLSMGWTHNYDITIYGPVPDHSWGPVTLVYSNDAQEPLTPILNRRGRPTGVFRTPIGRPYTVRGVPGTEPGAWRSLTLTWDKYLDGNVTRWRFTPLSVDHITEYPLTQITDGQGRSLGLAYDQRRALLCVSSLPGGRALMRFGYDRVGHLATLTDDKGEQVVYTFGGLDINPGYQVLQTVYRQAGASGSAISDRYDYYLVNAAAQLSSATTTRPFGHGTWTISIAYDGDNRVSMYTDPYQEVYSYFYDHDRGTTQVQARSAKGTLFLDYLQHYDAQGRDTGITDAAGHRTLIVYGDAHNPLRPTQMVDKYGHVTTYVYGPHGELLRTSKPAANSRLSADDLPAYDAQHHHDEQMVDGPNVYGDATYLRPR